MQTSFANRTSNFKHINQQMDTFSKHIPTANKSHRRRMHTYGCHEETLGICVKHVHSRGRWKERQGGEEATVRLRKRGNSLQVGEGGITPHCLGKDTDPLIANVVAAEAEYRMKTMEDGQMRRDGAMRWC